MIKIARRSELKACFARFIWASLEIQEAERAERWQSNVRVGSNITPKSLTESVGKSFSSATTLTLVTTATTVTAVRIVKTVTMVTTVKTVTLATTMTLVTTVTAVTMVT